MEKETTTATFESLLESIEKLSLSEKKELAEVLFEKYWEQKSLSIFPPVFSSVLNKGKFFNKLLSNLTNDPQFELEQAYMDIQTNLIQVRQAVAQQIATQKQINEQIEKIKSFKQSMLDSLVDETDPKVIAEKHEKISSFERSLAAAIKQEVDQGIRMNELRKSLKDSEMFAQKAYTMKQSLIARSKGVSAHARAKKLLEEFFSTNLDSEIMRFENQVKKSESETNLFNAEDSSEDEDFMIRNLKALQHHTWVLERVEELLLKYQEKK